LIEQLGSRPAPARTRRAMERVSLTLPKNEAFISAARLTAAGIGIRTGLAYETIEDLKIIITEACTYCIRRGGRKGRLRVELDIESASITVTVSDPGFEKVEDAKIERDSGDQLDELFVIRNLADELEYRASPGGGIRLRMTKAVG